LIKFRMMKDLAQGKINLNELIKLITEKYNPEKIILFGSHARGETDEYSDLDLILIKKTDKGFVERLVDPILLKILPPKTDCFVYTPEEFEQMKENENPFILKALENYKILYEKS
jgi:predicted nucleotidyltransferase